MEVARVPAIVSYRLGSIITQKQKHKRQWNIERIFTPIIQTTCMHYTASMDNIAYLRCK